MTLDLARTQLFAAGLLVTVALTFGAACGDDDDASGDSTPTPEPSASGDGTPRVSATPTPGSLEALAAYLEETGIDGQTGALTDPFDCAEITDDTDGDFCIRNEVSIYGPGRVVLYVADVEDTDARVWSVRVTLTDNTWEVTGVENLAEGE
jgi:hypothetical protein